MKLKKWVEGVLVVCLIISLGLITMTIDSEFTKEYTLFFISNLLVVIGSGYLLVKFGG